MAEKKIEVPVNLSRAIFAMCEDLNSRRGLSEPDIEWHAHNLGSIIMRVIGEAAQGAPAAEESHWVWDVCLLGKQETFVLDTYNTEKEAQSYCKVLKTTAPKEQWAVRTRAIGTPVAPPDPGWPFVWDVCLFREERDSVIVRTYRTRAEAESCCQALMAVTYTTPWIILGRDLRDEPAHASR